MTSWTLQNMEWCMEWYVASDGNYSEEVTWHVYIINNVLFWSWPHYFIGTPHSYNIFFKTVMFLCWGQYDFLPLNCVCFARWWSVFEIWTTWVADCTFVTWYGLEWPNSELHKPSVKHIVEAPICDSIHSFPSDPSPHCFNCNKVLNVQL
jgi:hypothetical protein